MPESRVEYAPRRAEVMRGPEWLHTAQQNGGASLSYSKKLNDKGASPDSPSQPSKESVTLGSQTGRIKHRK